MSITTDLKTSWNYLRPNFLKMLVAMIGSIGLVLIPILVASIGYAIILMIMNNNLDFVLIWTNLIISMIEYIISGGMWILSGPFMGVILAGVAFSACFFSAVYILSGDIVSEHYSTALGAIFWLRQKFIPLTLTTLLNVVVAIVPAVGLWWGISSLYGFGIFPFPVDVILGLLGFIWLFIILGLLQLHVPATVENIPIFEGMKYSIRNVRKNITRVFSLWTVLVVLILIWFVPYAIYMYILGGVFSFTDFMSLAVGGIALVGVGLDLLIFVPMLILGMTKIYQDTRKNE